MTPTDDHKAPKVSCEHNFDSDVNSSPFCLNKTSEDPVSSHMLAYLKKLKVNKLCDQLVVDPRQGECKYTLPSLLSTALLTVLSLNESKNSFQTQAHHNFNVTENVSKFIGRDDGALPVTRTVDDVLKKLDFEEFNDLLMQLFENTRISKLFFDHNELIPSGEYHIAFDGEKIHTYSPDNNHDCESCPYCLKRSRGDTVWYCHTIVVASLVCPGGFKLPIYVYPIHAQAVRDKETVSDDVHKQECELSALKVIIPMLRKRFPRLKMCALLDSLYANGPILNLLQINNFSYAIVRKKGSMSTVGEDCSGLLRLPKYEKSHSVEKNFVDRSSRKIQQKITYFNDIQYQGKTINLLRFNEKIIASCGKEKFVYWEWIVSWKVTKKNAFSSAERGRLRWHQEDLFNTVENRGYAIEHDYSRNPKAQMVWVVLIMIAIFINECFARTQAMLKRRGKMSVKDFLKTVFSELCYLSFNRLFCAPILHKHSQFRYYFGIDPPFQY